MFSRTEVISLACGRCRRISYFDGLRCCVGMVLSGLYESGVVNIRFGGVAASALIYGFSRCDSEGGSSCCVGLASRAFGGGGSVTLPRVGVTPSRRVSLVVRRTLPNVAFAIVSIIASRLRMESGVV